MKDDSFPKEVFTVIRGQVEMKWSRIPAGSNVTHVVVVTANIPGYFNFTAAAVSYKSTEDGELQVFNYIQHDLVLLLLLFLKDSI